jgi:hypothetical protein
MNNNFYIILLTGPAGSGKDTLFNILYEIYNHDFHIVKLAFGDSLKIITSHLTKLFTNINFNINDMNNLEYKEKEINNIKLYINNNQETFTIRKALQFIGTDIMRKYIDDNIFVNVIINKINSLLNQNFNKKTIIILTDLRFPNEQSELYNFSKKFDINIKTFLIHRDNINISNHLSENLFNKLHIDFVINNNSSIYNLKKFILDNNIFDIL